MTASYEKVMILTKWSLRNMEHDRVHVLYGEVLLRHACVQLDNYGEFLLEYVIVFRT